jgi:two-component system sensor histidine kinase KdpD
VSVTSLFDRPSSEVGSPARLVNVLMTDTADEPIRVRARQRGGATFPAEVTVCRPVDDRAWTHTFVFGVLHEARVSSKAGRVGRRPSKEPSLSAEQVQRTLLRAIVHELRDPLSVIRGLIQLLKKEHEGIVELSDDVHRDAIEQIRSAARKMSRLLNDLLDTERLEQGLIEPHRSSVDLERLVRRIVETSTDVHDHRVVFHTVPAVASVDPIQIETIVGNLLQNAAKYSPPGSPITVRLDHNEGGVILSIEDEGEGVPSNERRSIFKPFRRGRGMRGSGVGIGLSLVAAFAKLHGGEAWVEDAPLGGSAFRVAIPSESTGA